MRQMTVFCSRDLEPRVVSAFDRAGVEGYLRLSGATGQKFMPPGQVPRTMTWEALALVVPAANDGAVESVVAELRIYAGSCEIQPCLRIVVAPIDEML